MEAQPTHIPGAEAEVYKRVDGWDLAIHRMDPPGVSPSDRRPGIVFFFGGGWSQGKLGQFAPQARYLAARGMVSFLADYRVLKRHGTGPRQCVADGKSAVRWVRRHAGRLGVDPARIVAAGGSAGGHVAASAGVLPGLDEPGEPTDVGSRPDAMVLFNPGLVIGPVQPDAYLDEERLGQRFGRDVPNLFSPHHQLAPGCPPTLILHGRADTVIPYVSVEAYARKAVDLGNRCELIGYDGQGHGFFNHRPGDREMFEATLTAADRFLASLGYLEGQPEVTGFFKAQEDGQTATACPAR